MVFLLSHSGPCYEHLNTGMRAHVDLFWQPVYQDGVQHIYAGCEGYTPHGCPRSQGLRSRAAVGQVVAVGQVLAGPHNVGNNS